MTSHDISDSSVYDPSLRKLPPDAPYLPYSKVSKFRCDLVHCYQLWLASLAKNDTSAELYLNKNMQLRMLIDGLERYKDNHARPELRGHTRLTQDLQAMHNAALELSSV